MLAVAAVYDVFVFQRMKLQQLPGIFYKVNSFCFLLGLSKVGLVFFFIVY